MPCQEDSDDDSSSFLSERRLPDMSKGAFLCGCFSWAVAAIFPGLVYFRVSTDHYKDLCIYVYAYVNMYVSIYTHTYIYIFIYIVHVSWGISESSSGFPTNWPVWRVGPKWVPWPVCFVSWPHSTGTSRNQMGQEGYPKIWHGRL